MEKTKLYSENVMLQVRRTLKASFKLHHILYGTELLLKMLNKITFEI